jgi:hypothetical protein
MTQPRRTDRRQSVINPERTRQFLDLRRGIVTADICGTVALHVVFSFINAVMPHIRKN